MSPEIFVYAFLSFSVSLFRNVFLSVSYFLARLPSFTPIQHFYLEKCDEDVWVGVAEQHYGQEGAEAPVKHRGAHVDEGLS